jgi:O-antigen ligase
MAVKSGNRFPLSRVTSTAVAETRLAVRAAPGIVRHVAPVAAWAVASIALGLVVGLAAVILPPLGAFSIVAVAAVLLLWVMPDLPLVAPGLIRKACFVMLIADLSIPFYYTVQFGGLPWISARRLATFALIAPFLIAIAASSEVRRHITERIRASLPIFICAAGFLVIAALSILTSALPSESMSALVDAILSWYVPFFAIVYMVRSKTDIILILKIICVCAIFISAEGLVEFRLQRNLFVQMFPSGMLAQLIGNNPQLSSLLPGIWHFRNGLYRAFSAFVTPLSFGEFEIVVIPIGLFFAFYRQNLFEKILGSAVVFGGILGIYVSGSRGGWVGVIASVAVFVAVWSIRKATTHRASLAPATAGLTGAIFFALVILAVAFVGKIHNTVLGSSGQAGSTDARAIQFHAGMQFIKSNPITGHGFSIGGFIINSSIDSYVTSLLVETGVPGFVFFAGLLLLPIWYGLRSYFSDMSESGAVAGALACSFVAFTFDRLVLSQKENHMLIFSLLAITVVLTYEYAKKRVPERLSYKSPPKTHPRAEGNVSFSSPSARRGAADESHRTIENEAWAAQMASLILAVLIVVLLGICVHTL